VLRELTEETGLTGTVGELLDVDSQVRDFYELGGSDRVYHAIRILYRATVATTGPLVVHDTDGSSDSPTWVPVGEVAALPMVTPVARLALRHLPVPAPQAGSTTRS
jgi:8-oxo-dGTP pyrophosphatase MutT (NUDIX family)